MRRQSDNGDAAFWLDAALIAAERGLIHLDLKPANLMVVSGVRKTAIGDKSSSVPYNSSPVNSGAELVGMSGSRPSCG